MDQVGEALGLHGVVRKDYLLDPVMYGIWCCLYVHVLVLLILTFFFDLVAFKNTRDQCGIGAELIIASL